MAYNISGLCATDGGKIITHCNSVQCKRSFTLFASPSTLKNPFFQSSLKGIDEVPGAQYSLLSLISLR